MTKATASVTRLPFIRKSLKSARASCAHLRVVVSSGTGIPGKYDLTRQPGLAREARRRRGYGMEARLLESVFPTDTNPQGNLFGGTLVAWMDKAAGFAAMRRARSSVVTAAIEDIAFQVPILQGELVEISPPSSRWAARACACGWRCARSTPSSGTSELCTVGHFTMVAMGPDRKPRRGPAREAAAGRPRTRPWRLRPGRLPLGHGRPLRGSGRGTPRSSGRAPRRGRGRAPAPPGRGAARRPPWRRGSTRACTTSSRSSASRRSTPAHRQARPRRAGSGAGRDRARGPAGGRAPRARATGAPPPGPGGRRRRSCAAPSRTAWSGPSSPSRRQRHRQPHHERHVGRHVRARGAGGERAHLEPQVGIVARRRAPCGSSATPCRGGAAARRAPGTPPAAHGLQRVLVAEHRQDRDVQGDALARTARAASADPAVAERGARGQPGVGDRRAVVDRLPEQRDPGLLPQHPPHQERRVDRRGQDRADGHLGRVHRGREAPTGARAGARAGPWRRPPGSRRPRSCRGSRALDPDLEGPAAQAAEPRVQRPVARGVAHRRGAQVLRAQGGEDPDRHGAGAAAARRRPRCAPSAPERSSAIAENGVPGQSLRRRSCTRG